MNLTKKNYLNRFLSKLATLQFAITLLFLIGILVAIGTIIEQDQTLVFYKDNYPETNPMFGFLTWKLVINLGLDHLYSNFGFIFLLFIFTVSLITCTFTTQVPSLKKFRLWQFLAKFKQLKRLSVFDQMQRSTGNCVAFLLYENNYHLFRQGRRTYAYSGLLGRLGPIIVHFSIMALLVGTSWGALSGYNVQEIVPRGEVLHLQNLVKSGPLSRLSTNTVLRVNDFWITYTTESKINQFYSDVSLLNRTGSEVIRKTIFVNEPLQASGLTIYQTDWDLVGLKLSVNGSNDIQIPLQKLTKSGRKFWVGSVKLKNNVNKQFTILCNDLQGDVYIYDKQGILLQKVPLGTKATLDTSNTIVFRTFITSTGLQIKEDPGLFLVYFSFLSLMLSVYISFFSYSQIWGLEEQQKFVIGGKSNRAILAFQEKFKRTMRLVD